MLSVQESKSPNSQVSQKSSNAKVSGMCEKYFRTFNLINNRKEPTSEWAKDPAKQMKNKWKSLSIETLEDFDTPKSKGIPCGKPNNIVVIDLDFYDKYTIKGELKKKFNYDDNLFIKQFGGIEKCKEIFKDTLVVETARGGLHLYFNYDPTITTAQNNELGIDIRSDGGYVVSMGTQIDKRFYNNKLKGAERMGQYKVVNNKPITDIPVELAIFLKNNMWRKRISKKPLKKKTTGEIDVAVEPLDQDQIDLTQYVYDFNDEILRRILDGLPDRYFTNDTDWMIFSTAMMTLDKHDIWDEYSKAKGGDTYCSGTNETKWEYKVFQYKTFLCLEHILCNSNFIIGNLLQEDFKEEKDYLDAIKSKASQFLGYYKYKPTDCHNTIPDVILDDRKYLDPNNNGDFLIREVQDNVIAQSDTGTGKTTAFKNYIKKSGRRFISIVSRVSLGKEQAKIFTDEGIECHWHEDINDGWYMYEGQNIVITIDSLMKMGHWHDFDDYVIYMDEFNSLIEYFIDCPNLDTKRILVKDFLTQIIKDCDRLIGTDADISDNSLLFLKQRGVEFTYIQNKYKHNKGIEATELYNYEELIGNLNKLDKFMVCCDSKLSALKIYDDLIALGKDKDKILCITSDTTKHENLDDFDMVIFSPKIVYGLDSLMEREVFAFMKGHTISPTAMVQQIARCRKILKLSFLFQTKNWQPYKYESVDECRDFMLSGMKQFHSQGYSNRSTDKKDEDDFNELVVNFEYTKDCYNTNKFAHFLNIIKQRGFVCEYNIQKSKGIGTQHAKKYKEDKINTIGEIVEQCIAKRDEEDNKLDNEDIMAMFMPEGWMKHIKILKIPIDEILNYADIITDEKEVSKHFNKRDFFINDHQFKQKLDEALDYNIKKFQHDDNKIIFTKKIMTALGMNFNDLTDFKITKVVEPEDTDKLFLEYKNIFGRYRGKENPFKTPKGCKSMIIKVYKELFGKDIIITHATSVDNKKTGKKDKVYKYEINNEMVERTKFIVEEGWGTEIYYDGGILMDDSDESSDEE
mgnify:CR=1 FL=1